MGPNDQPQLAIRTPPEDALLPVGPPHDALPPEAPAECQEADAAAFLDGIPHVCFSLDGEGRFTYLNARARQFFGSLSGQGRGELLGHVIWDEFQDVADSTFARECKEALTEQRPIEVETFYPALGRWFAVRVSPAAGGLHVFLQDIHERAVAERDLLQRAEELTAADRGKDEFLVQLAHEVRNALAPVRNALHLTRAGGASDPEATRVSALAEQEVRRLSRVMDDLLKVAHLLPGKVPVHKEQINLAEVVARAMTAALSSPEAGGRSLTVHLPPEPLWVEGDPAHLEQVVTHLLENAVKFTRPGGHVRLSAAREDGRVVLRTRDDGVGISAEALPHVFNLFMRADRGPDPFQGGLGIGLTVVRRLVELHGGSVEAHSDGPGRGSEFVVRLLAAGTSKRERPRDAADGKRLGVLVVDDSVDAAQSLAFVLESWGHTVRAVYDGPAAIEAVRERRPDVVLLDIGMPGMNGYVVAERLRRLPGAEELILVAVTGYGQEDDRTRAREAGFDYHMVKPVEPADLKELLDAAGKVVRGATLT